MLRNMGAFLKKRRTDLSMTQETLAESLGVSAKFVSKWERGLCLPPMEKLKMICKVLDIPTDEMIRRLMDVQKKRISKLLSS